MRTTLPLALRPRRNPLFRRLTAVAGVDIEGGSRLAGARAIGWYKNGGSNEGFQYCQLL